MCTVIGGYLTCWGYLSDQKYVTFKGSGGHILLIALPVDAEIINLDISLREKKVWTLLHFFFILKIIFEKNISFL